MYDNQSPTDNLPTHQKKVAAAAKKFGDQVQATRKSLNQGLADGVREISNRMSQKVDLTENPYAPEVRAQFRTLDSRAKAGAIQEAVDGNDGPGLAALIGAPSLVTGLTTEQKSRYRDGIHSRHAPAEFEELKVFQEANSTAYRATEPLAEIAKEFLQPGVVAAIERGELKSAEIAKAFEDSLKE